MKTRSFTFILFFAALIALQLEFGYAQNIAINETGANAADCAILDVSSSNKGMLIPRVSIANTGTYGLAGTAATGLLVYNTNNGIAGTGAAGTGFYYWNIVLTRWIKIVDGGTAAWLLAGNSGTTPGTDFLGTTDANDLVFKTNNTEKARIKSGGNVGIGITTPANKLGVVGGNIGWGNASEVSILQNDQGGSIELGGQNSIANPQVGGAPYIDFHYGTGGAQDYNARIINAAQTIG